MGTTTDTYFARHTVRLDIDASTRELLWRERRIAIHYPWLKEGSPSPRDSQSLTASDYHDVGSRRAINALANLAKDGGYVCAQYLDQPSLVVGYVEPVTKIEILEGRWGTRTYGEKGKNRVAILKSLRLTRPRDVDPMSHAVLIVGRPRQGTLMRWRLAGETVKNLVERRNVAPSLGRLSVPQQEIMCSEFLRTAPKKYHLPRLQHLLLPTGKTMKDLDIVGITPDGERLFAQVTYSSKNSGAGREKADRLREYAGKGMNLVFFCACDEVHEEGGVTFVPMETVFDEFSRSETGARWLKLSV